MNADDIGAILKQQLASVSTQPQDDEIGHVLSVGDGVARVTGLTAVMAGEEVIFKSGTRGLALNLEEEFVGVAILGSDADVEEDDEVRRTKNTIQVPCGEALLGRIVDGLGNPIDGGEPFPDSVTMRPAEAPAPGIIQRANVKEPLMTGIVMIDSLTAIGRGQRQLIIGDRKTGKTTIAIDTILNQADKDVYCFYVAIGQKRSTIAQLHETLKQRGAMKYTTIIAATASDPAPVQYLAPFTATAMAEHFRDNKKHALIIYDDLTKHAQAYRQLSLLLRRPPGRDAFPGDNFYLHSRLLERSAKLSEELGSGSLTALPIVETQASDISAYIPTNVISITDGQLFLESSTFNAGQRPAINPGTSVSRVGGDAQSKLIKMVSSSLRIDLAQYRELASFSQFVSDLDPATSARLEQGRRAMTALKQGVHAPMPLANQAMLLLAATSGLLTQIPNDAVKPFQKALDDALGTTLKPLADELNTSPADPKPLKDKMLAALQTLVDDFKTALPQKPDEHAPAGARPKSPNL